MVDVLDEDPTVVEVLVVSVVLVTSPCFVVVVEVSTLELEVVGLPVVGASCPSVEPDKPVVSATIIPVKLTINANIPIKIKVFKNLLLILPIFKNFQINFSFSILNLVYYFLLIPVKYQYFYLDFYVNFKDI